MHIIYAFPTLMLIAFYAYNLCISDAHAYSILCIQFYAFPTHMLIAFYAYNLCISDNHAYSIL